MVRMNVVVHYRLNLFAILPELHLEVEPLESPVQQAVSGGSPHDLRDVDGYRPLRVQPDFYPVIRTKLYLPLAVEREAAGSGLHLHGFSGFYPPVVADADRHHEPRSQRHGYYLLRMLNFFELYVEAVFRLAGDRL